MNINQRSIELHKKLKGKLEVKSKFKIESIEDLSLLYSPGVSAPCDEIATNTEDVYEYTWKGNTVAVISDGSAVLGMGNIGPEASLPVMEGKAILFKEFANVNAVPIVLDTQDTDEIIKVVKTIAPGFGGINLEDISSPRCVEIERVLEEELSIPVFHDDQHGTAIVTLAGLINALRVVNKKPEDIKVVISGTGAAGSAIIKLLSEYGIGRILAFNSSGIVHDDSVTNIVIDEIKKITNLNNEIRTLEEAIVGADVFIGVSVSNILSKEMVQSMKENPIVFALANPDPEINYDLAKESGARIVATGRSDYPNQINNVLVFPGLFKGLLETRAKRVPIELKVAVSKALAEIISEDDLSDTNIIPSIFDVEVVKTVSEVTKNIVLDLRENGHNI